MGARTDTLISRGFHDLGDLTKMAMVLRNSRAASGLLEYPGPTDLDELMHVPAIRERTRLWEDTRGNCAAFAVVDPWNNIWFEALPGILNEAIECDIIVWGVHCARAVEAHVAGRPSTTLETNCLLENSERIALLKRNGFAELPVRTVQMRRDLQEPIGAPRWPEGFSMRCVRGKDEVEELVNLHRAAFGTEDMTVDYRRSMMETAGYETELDLLAVAPNGDLAGFCTCQVDAASGGSEGFADPIGTHPEYRGKGLARSLLLEGLRLLRQRGVERVRLGTSSKNAAMQSVAASVGFTIDRTKVWFARPVQVE